MYTGEGKKKHKTFFPYLFFSAFPILKEKKGTYIKKKVKKKIKKTGLKEKEYVLQINGGLLQHIMMMYQHCRAGAALRPNGNLLHTVEPAVVPDFLSDVQNKKR